MRLVPTFGTLLLLLQCVAVFGPVRVTTAEQCGLPGTGQTDPFRLATQLTGTFVPPVPVAPVAIAPPVRNRPWISFGRQAAADGSSTEQLPKPGNAVSAFEQILSSFFGRPGRILRRRRTRREVGNSTASGGLTLARVKRIVGGYDATPGQVCWQVKVQIGSAFDETICGGSIIGTRTILMAAHCLFDEETKRRVMDRRVSVVVGGSNRDIGEPYGRDFTGCAETYAIERSVVHPAYNYDLNDNDIAILILARPIDLDRKTCACAICLNSRLPQPAEWCVVSGFGEESNDGRTDRSPVPLKWTQLQIRPNDYSGSCAFNSFARTAAGPGQRTNIDLFVCAGTQPYEDTCQGDSGGPLVCLDPVRGNYYQAGITSFGDDCGAGVGGQYTKVGAYIPWIIAMSPVGDVGAS
ncbi:putative Tryptase-2 [Hypsibius exemplaris]|uniref:Tryptase-2 n=1 Tax=Hypsibius exemplaris TaxID=2072580 RepID=A0A1W0X1Q6_HYPEX|nr:putative Tryptase-2 [Hypsibius exemplaris]